MSLHIIRMIDNLSTLCRNLTTHGNIYCHDDVDDKSIIKKKEVEQTVLTKGWITNTVIRITESNSGY